MIIGFIGDVHGQVFHATALAATWQVVTGKRFDILIQVGDMGAYPNTPNDAATERYLALDPSQADFSRLLKADGKLAAHLRQVRECLAGPIYFVRGNHEDFDFLNHLQVDGTAKSAAVDPFDLYRYVPDGTVLEFDGTKVAFLGGVEERSDARAIDKEAYQSLMDLGPGRIDILVTHEGPYGTSTGYHGDVHGSHMMTRLIESIKPTYHVAGHAHLSCRRARPPSVWTNHVRPHDLPWPRRPRCVRQVGAGEKWIQGRLFGSPGYSKRHVAAGDRFMAVHFRYQNL